MNAVLPDVAHCRCKLSISQTLRCAEAWDKAASVYCKLADLCSAGTDPAALAKSAGFMRRAAEAAKRGAQLELAEQCWRRLLATAAPDSPDRLELLCQLADVLLQADQQQLAGRLQAYIAAAMVQGMEVRAVCVVLCVQECVITRCHSLSRCLPAD